MPIDTIKIDRTFIAKLNDQPGGQEIVAAIIGLAHGLGMAVVSEGIETSQQHRAVAKLGSDWCQGFFFAKPMLAPLIDSVIRERGAGRQPRLPAPG